MNQTKYRVEAFIVPVGNDYHTNSVLSEADDLKVKINKVDNAIVNIERNESSYIINYRNDLLSAKEENVQNLKNCIALEKFNETNRVDINETKESPSDNFYSSLCIPRSQCKKLYNADDADFSSFVVNNVHRLTPIVEKNEDSEDKHMDLCHHGRKNGCSATVPTPQEVTEDVFKENWLKKLEDIKQREAVLRNREISLENREKVVFRKEREIKILERQLKDKLKQLHLHVKETKCLQDLLKMHNSQKNSSESLVNIDPKVTHKEFHLNNDSVEKLDVIDVDKLNSCIPNVCSQDTPCNQIQQLDKQMDDIGKMYKDLQQEKASIGSSSCSSDNSTSERKRSKQRLNVKSSMTLKSTYSKSANNNNNNKIKKPCKIYYEDLDTTLSADIGDSSFVQTSQKFNPDLYRRPYAFTRSASERRGKYASKGSSTNLEVQNLGNHREAFIAPIQIEQDKVLERVTKNISASQDKSTKFQHYGLIDHNIDTRNKVYKIENEEKYSYLNLETGNMLCSHQKLIKGSKDRPVSWNEETNEWLQKKRKAYNMTTKKVLPEDIEDKENFRCNSKMNKSEKVIKKKDIRNKILTIFR